MLPGSFFFIRFLYAIHVPFLSDVGICSIFSAILGVVGVKWEVNGVFCAVFKEFFELVFYVVSVIFLKWCVDEVAKENIKK